VRAFQNQFSSNVSIDEGITISSNPLSLNASFSIRDHFDPDSIVTDESNSHSRKSDPKISIDRGIETDLRIVFENPRAPIRSNIETFSNTRN
jgi:hypothetical protein